MLKLKNKLFSGFKCDKFYSSQAIKKNPVPAGQTFILYPLSQLEQLLNDAREAKYQKKLKLLDPLDPNACEELRKEINNTPVCLRYVVDSEFKLWFSREGRPSKNVPGHGQMASGCYAAGNVTCNNEDHIIKINHKSGDFHPGFSSLLWVFLILNRSEPFKTLLASEIEIEQLNSSCGTHQKFIVKKETLLEHTKLWEKEEALTSINSDITDKCGKQPEESETKIVPALKRDLLKTPPRYSLFDSPSKENEQSSENRFPTENSSRKRSYGESSAGNESEGQPKKRQIPFSLPF